MDKEINVSNVITGQREEGIEATMVKLAELEGNVGIKGMVRVKEGGKGRVDVFETSWFVA